MPLTEFLNRLLNFTKSLNQRMRELLFKYNNGTFDNSKPYIISLKSKKILEYVNNINNSINEKVDSWYEYNKLLVDISKQCYVRFNPSLIYTFNDEIHLVFYNDNNTYLGNINKTLTTIVSFVTYLFAKESSYSDFTFYGKYIQFDTTYETLNYLIWRQNDCKRNNIITLYKYFDENCNELSLLNIINKLDNLEFDITNETLYPILYGNILKKELVYSEDKNKELINRKVIVNSSILLSDNFTENLQKYIYNEHL